ncbi:DNA-binding transcriptional ArsR family regulator [Streptosporangium becharense]|uniref:DNA-binding transcriptional ArsR family regulator n=1 Tax=Streptosporangium becharense TaxID=1816182 RepID=A0A7W9IIY4_9ACTN|nr:helix-turn-helix domain-containing protein [Streptosporangium becharense]MBB2911375.1 DNA-binding transcriptional ArsR family regulator [Streptosporangium becharense]MBB5821567.1 DNA-binding transcriptional ArsR family regulator [Streptosporangium becharense]
MVYRIEVSPQDIVASRFAISPLIVTHHALWILSGRKNAGVWRSWVERMRKPYLNLLARHPGLVATVALFRERHYNVDFCAPPPNGVNTPFEAELAVVRATPAEQAHEEITRNLAGITPRPPAAVMEVLFSPGVVASFADALQATWDEIVAPAWPHFHALLERDVVQRAGRLATYGWAAALDDLDPKVRWDPDGTIEVEGSGPDRTHRLGGRGLLFVPTVFPTGLGSHLEERWPYAISYPARGTGVPYRAPDGLAGLIGRTRARLLLELAVPATTTQLAALLGLGLGTVGGHLGALRRAGLVTGDRTGRSVLYHRTALGDSLAGASGTGGP